MLSLARRLSCRRPPPSFRLLPLSSSSPSPHSLPPLPSRPPRPTSANPSSSVPPLSLLRPFSSSSLPSLPPLCASADSDTAAGPLCPGCGVLMQHADPALPGFFSCPSPKSRLPFAGDDPLYSLSIKSALLEPEERHEGAEQADGDPKARPLVCARCHSLRHYGRVKHPDAERLLPAFDFARLLGPKLASPAGRRTLVLLLADAADFDGSFPRMAARFLSASLDAHSAAWRQSSPANVPRVILVVTKVDLLPKPSVSLERVEEWARARARAGGLDRLAGVHLVSAMKDWGVWDLVDRIRELTGPRGDVWAVGAQNAGKSTLINAMGRCVVGKAGQLTEAPVPGTTLGVVRVEGILEEPARLFDTPGILNPCQITTRLTSDEQRLVQVGKELRPRTYRIKVGHSVHVGGLMRLDVEELSVDTIYVTVWASPLLPLHMGKTENASTMIENHFGRQLQPPIGENRVKELGTWTRKEFKVTGSSWDASSVDIAVAGLGWFAIGLRGEALLGVWTYDGVDVMSRSSLIHKRASIFEEAGFTVSKIVSRADSKSNKPARNNKAEKQQASIKFRSLESVSAMSA